jgi:hypothetical protein
MNELKQPQFCDGCGLNMASAKAQMNREPDLAKALQWLESWLCLDDDSIARKFATTLWQHFQAKDERIAELEEEKLSVEVNLMARHSKVETDEYESLKAERDVLQEKLLNALDVLRVNGLGAYVDRIRQGNPQSGENR